MAWLLGESVERERRGATAALACGVRTSQGGSRAVGGRSLHVRSQKCFGEFSFQPRGRGAWLAACFFPNGLVSPATHIPQSMLPAFKFLDPSFLQCRAHVPAKKPRGGGAGVGSEPRHWHYLVFHHSPALRQGLDAALGLAHRKSSSRKAKTTLDLVPSKPTRGLENTKPPFFWEKCKHVRVALNK